MLVEKETDTGADQMLPEIPLLAGLDLGAGVIEVFILDKGAHARIEKVI